MTNPVLTTEALDGEFANWCRSNAGNRDGRDWRFGQMIFNNYHLVPDEVFHMEDRLEAYKFLLKALLDYQR